MLADCGSTVHGDSEYAKMGDIIGAPIFRSPEAQLQMRWGTATDIWSLGAMASDLVLISDKLINSYLLRSLSASSGVKTGIFLNQMSRSRMSSSM